MITINLSAKSIHDQPVSSRVWFLEEGFTFGKELNALAKHLFPSLQQFFNERGFTGKANSGITLPIWHDEKLLHLIFVGLGKKHGKTLTMENYRRAVGRAVRLAESHKLSSFAFELLNPKDFGVDLNHLVQQTVTTAHMAGYHFDDFKRDRQSTKELAITICIDKAQQKAAEQAKKAGEIIAAAVNTTRHQIDTPPSRLTPTHLAEHAERVAKENKLKITVFGEPEIIKMGMGGLAAVSAGSHQDAKFIIMEYNGGKKTDKRIALVGKGITFDSGGLSIKPAASMETMKEDMAGAASVINAIGALAALKAPVNVVAIAPTSENLPSGTATKPGDIIKFYNGKTAEVRNTDAEGRLILADALSYAVKHFEPGLIVDVATLTGACDYAVGPFYSGLFTMDDKLADTALAAAQKSGDRVWRLPLHEDYEFAIASDVADLCNIGKSNYKAGATTAAMFLKHFVDDCPWIHLDIASNAFDLPSTSYVEHGASGASVRLLIELALSYK